MFFKRLVEFIGFRQTLKSLYQDTTFLALRLTFPFRYLSFKASNKSNLRKLHLGCGSRKIKGWINVDAKKSDLQLNLSRAYLPFPDSSLTAVVMQRH